MENIVFTIGNIIAFIFLYLGIHHLQKANDGIREIITDLEKREAEVNKTTKDSLDALHEAEVVKAEARDLLNKAEQYQKETLEEIKRFQKLETAPASNTPHW